MADYWKSQPRKFCQYCKCWIADNKPSIEFHERGKNHKENVAAKISEIKKKSVNKAKQDKRASKQFAAMEEAAQKAYEEDLKRMEREAAGLPPIQTPPPPQPQAKPLVVSQPRPQDRIPAKKQQKKDKASKKFRDQRHTQVWVEGRADDGNTYYYNTVTGESKWEKPDDLQRQQPVQPVQSSSGWMEALSPDGYPYYYNSQTGESSWEKPADLPVNEASGSGSNKEKESPEAEDRGTPASQEEEGAEQASEQPDVPDISFRKRKAEEKEGEVTDEAPKEEAEGMKTAEPEQRKEEPVKTQAKRVKSANPYGAWEKIQEKVDPYAKVDLQLPQVEVSAPSAPPNLPPETKPKFKERVITSLGEQGGPASFRKKTQNGKSRSLRQREDDD